MLFSVMVDKYYLRNQNTTTLMILKSLLVVKCASNAALPYNARDERTAERRQRQSEGTDALWS